MMRGMAEKLEQWALILKFESGNIKRSIAVSSPVSGYISV